MVKKKKHKREDAKFIGIFSTRSKNMEMKMKSKTGEMAIFIVKKEFLWVYKFYLLIKHANVHESSISLSFVRFQFIQFAFVEMK